MDTSVRQISDGAWSQPADDDDEGHTSSGQRVRRAIRGSVSCETCKMRKVRCDRARPACGWCVKNNHGCRYKERKKPGLRAGYGRELECRMETLENLVHTQQQWLARLSARLDQSTTSGSIVVQTDCGSNDPSQTPLVQQSPESYYSTHSAGPRQHATRPEQSSTAVYDHTKSARLAEEGLPDSDLMSHLFNLYFEHIDPWCPILHRQTTFHSIASTWPLQNDDMILLHAIVATSLRFSNHDRLQGQASKRYHDHCKQKVLLYGLESSSVKSLQALTILAFDVVGTSNGPPGWNLLGMIARNAVHLAIGKEQSADASATYLPSISTLQADLLAEPDSFVEEESRRRLLWAIYLLDRLTTLTSALNFALDESDINRRIPCREEMFVRNQTVTTRLPLDFREPIHTHSNAGLFGYYIEVVCILSKIHLFLKQPVNIASEAEVARWRQQYLELESLLHSWHTRLPPEHQDIQSSDAPTHSQNLNSMWIMLHITYHMTTIRLHSSAAYPTHRSDLFTPSFTASQKCLTAVDRICTLCTHAISNALIDRLGPPFVFCVWVAARLLLVHGSTVDHSVSPAITGLVDTLRISGRYWPVALGYANLLERVLEEYIEKENPAFGSARPAEAPSSVTILADMRRCAYDLDVLISRQPRLQNNAQPLVNTVNGNTHNELDYLDLFDFFNLPRMPFDTEQQRTAPDVQNNFPAYTHEPAMPHAEINFTNPLLDSSTDWLFDYHEAL